MNVFLCLYMDKNGIETIFTQKLLINFTNDYNETEHILIKYLKYKALSVSF